MSTKKPKTVETFNLKPSEVMASLKIAREAMRSTFLWGPPGISKSAVARALADELAIAFIDNRLSQSDPSDLRGIPYPTTIAGREVMKFSISETLPQNMDLDFVRNILVPGEHKIEISNPKGSNGIHFVTNPKITVTPINPKHTVEIVTDYERDEEGEIVYFNSIGEKVTAAEGSPRKARKLDSITVILRDENGAPTIGDVRIIAKGKARAILALEEFNSAPPSVQAAAYQLVLDRRLGEYIVPDGVVIVAMGNRDTDKGITFKMATPIANRFVHVEMRPDFEDWQRWAIKAFVHRDVVGFLTQFKNHLFQFDPGTALRGFPTPRSWQFVSDILKADEKNPQSDMVVHGLVAGCVGEGVAVEFLEFRSVARDLPKAEEILSGKLKKMKDLPQVSLSYALTTSLCYELKERETALRRKHGENWNRTSDYKKYLDEADNFFEFMMENFQPEICIMGAKAAISIHDLGLDISAMKNFDVFTDRYRSLVLG